MRKISFMCGRFTRLYTWKQLHALLDLRWPEALEIIPSYNVAPTQIAPVCRIDSRGEREMVRMRWGLTPSWSPDGKPGPINARCETAATNGMFRSAYAARRCLVPASGFYEWRTVGDHKQPYYITLVNDPVFCFAALWERWGDSDQAVESFTILTTSPNEAVARVHDRMPVIIRPADFAEWLGAASVPAHLSAPWPAEETAMRPVSARVNSSRTDDAGLIEAADREGLFGE
jgi:putative SOS response-associated peptidase YedK